MPSTARPLRHDASLRVLEIHRPPAPSVRYVDQVVGEGQPGIEFRFGGFRAVVEGEPDVVHLHRLNPLLGPHGSRRKRLAMVMAVALFLKRRRIALVRTIHGARPDGAFARLSNWILDQVTTSVVVLDETTKAPGNRPVTLIPHGHYRDRFIGYPRAEQVQGRVLCFAPVRPGRELEGPLSDFAMTPTSTLSLRTVGESSPELASLTEHAVPVTPRQASRFVGRVSDGALVKEISAAELVVLPRTTELEDLSLLLLALSLERPVLVPDVPSNQLLSDNVGVGWVHRYSGALTGSVVDRTVQSLRDGSPGGRPNLDDHDPAAISAQYATVFRTAAGGMRRGGSRRTP